MVSCTDSGSTASIVPVEFSSGAVKHFTGLAHASHTPNRPAPTPRARAAFPLAQQLQDTAARPGHQLHTNISVLGRRPSEQTVMCAFARVTMETPGMTGSPVCPQTATHRVGLVICALPTLAGQRAPNTHRRTSSACACRALSLSKGMRYAVSRLRQAQPTHIIPFNSVEPLFVNIVTFATLHRRTRGIALVARECKVRSI